MASHSDCGGGPHKGCHKLERLWIRAGGASVEPAYLMAAIAMAESGGDAGSVGTDGELGYWQIDPHYWSASAAPMENAREAVAVARAQGLSAWTTYNNGAFHGFCGA
jgi:hypothetical protein